VISTLTSPEGGLGVDITVPAGWERVQTDAFPVAFLAPEELGHRTSVAFSNEEFDPPTREGLAAGIAMLRRAQASQYEGWELLDERELEVDGRYCYLEHYRWTMEVDPPLWMAQLVALVVMRPGVLLKVDGACLGQLSSTYLPMLDEVVTSLRFA
jgi:hypothetical protein